MAELVPVQTRVVSWLNSPICFCLFQACGSGPVKVQASRQMTKKRLGFCLRVHLSALLLDGPYGGEKKKTAFCSRDSPFERAS